MLVQVLNFVGLLVRKLKSQIKKKIFKKLYNAVGRKRMCKQAILRLVHGLPSSIVK